jgi:hypothetical protein
MEIYFLELDQTWRISALHSLRRDGISGRGGTFAAENQETMLLGYTASQRKAWLASMRHQRPVYGGITLYALLNKQQRSLAVSLGNGSFGAPTEIVGREFFIDRSEGDIKENALALLPEGTTLARVGFDWRQVQLLFGRPLGKLKRRGIVRATAPKEFAAIANDSLRSKIQFLTKRGWR